MTAETAVFKEVSEVVAKPPVLTEESGELCMSFNQDLLKPDCNGINHHDQGETSHHDHSHDPVNSFDFVSRKDGLSDDPLDKKDVVGEILSVSPNSGAVDVQTEATDAQNGKLGVENGKISESLEEEEIGVAEGSRRSLLLDNNVTQDKENSIGDGAEVHAATVDALVEQNEKSESRKDAEIKEDEVQIGKTACSEVEIELDQAQNGETGGTVGSLIGKVEDQTDLEVSPTTIENQESHVVVLGLDAGIESGDLDNLSLGINVSGDGSDTCEDHSNSKSTEGPGLGQESQDVINAVKVKSQGFEVNSQEQIEVNLAEEVAETLDCKATVTNSAHLDSNSPRNNEEKQVGEMSSQEHIELKLEGEIVETVACKVPVTNSWHLDSQRNPFSSKEENTKPELDSDEIKNQKCDTTVSTNDQDVIGQGYKEEETVDETDLKLETKTVSGPILEEIKEDLPVAHVLHPEEPDSHTDCNGESPAVVDSGTEINVALPSTSSSEASEPQKEIEICNAKRVEGVSLLPADGPKSESNVEKGPLVEGSMQSFNPSDANSESKSALEIVDHKERQPTSQGVDVHVRTEVSSGNANCAHSPCITADVILESEVENSSMLSRDMTTDGGVACESDVSNGSTVNDEGMLNISVKTEDVENLRDELAGAEGRSDGNNMLLKESDEIEKSKINQIITASPESSSADAITVEGTSVEAVTKTFNFLIRIPRFNDEELREQILHAQLQVEEKTQLRDAIRPQIQKKRANCQTHGIEYEAAKLEDRAGRKVVRSKRLEIDSLQSVINRAKNATSIEDIDSRIHNMEHVMQHETLPLKEEKQFIREIKQLKQLREQLSSNMGNQDEIQQALDQREQVEERLKELKKELDSLKVKVLRAEAAVIAAGKKYEDENKKVKELQDQFRAADEVRQAAYAQLVSLKKDFFDKNKHFRMYKDAAAAASDYAFGKSREALTRHCVDQVEKVMELWNTSENFRKEYVKYNARSTVRRLGTLDGRSLGPDEKPPILPGYVDRRVGNLVSTPALADLVSQHPILELKQETAVETVIVDDKSTEVAEPKNHVIKTKGPAKSKMANSLETNSGRDLTDETEEEPVKSKEKLELDRKAEELRKQEAEAKLREQRRLEEIAKAKEALERKKRNAEKAQMRAELRAQKEAERREKEKEKRLRKKESKKAAGTEGSENNDCETDHSSENPVENIKENEVKENAPVVAKRPSKHPHSTKLGKTKSIPPPLRNKNRKKIQQWMWVILTSLIIVVLFWLGNLSAFTNVNLKRQGPVP
ncbi:myosin-3-like [Olea europaea var. sylvestris]|uniref:myosin-3-like n=1 Tax=Olea europaea var. sylvestris TaxID=158386 RepID=UPI000C1CE91C|nr:myosin-3-like [Olea europaea var. sylvestris]